MQGKQGYASPQAFSSTAEKVGVRRIHTSAYKVVENIWSQLFKASLV
jgi:hypothetical protein